jgi:hypothetical protein
MSSEDPELLRIAANLYQASEGRLSIRQAMACSIQICGNTKQFGILRRHPATGGDHIGNDDFFIATERRERAEKIKKKEQEKETRQRLEKLQADAEVIKQTKLADGKAVASLTKADLVVLVKWKTQGKTAVSSLNKNALVTIWNERTEPPPVEAWSNEEEAELEALRSATISVDKTELGREAAQLAETFAAAVRNGTASTDVIEKVEQAVRERLTAQAQANNAANVEEL